MPTKLSKQRWVMIIATSPFIAAMACLAFASLGSEAPSESDMRIVSFKVYFDERVRFPERIRQSTIRGLLGPGFEIVDNGTTSNSATRTGSGDGQDRDCKIDKQGGLLTLRVPQSAGSNDIAARLKQLSRIKNIAVHMN